ncbi:DUF2292 domain-containing protein [Biomaibacter acetigenes]|uniref:DUF2292 domain-containing protein n=1 Tax=Biomaibacter acetigenes TaxID=2316383 RepID=A0A3G2R5Z1_9FIRM|nr:DUF2292 domain-containing protein [Biomaibacter acetigenes]
MRNICGRFAYASRLKNISIGGGKLNEQELHEKERRLLEFIRQLGHGEVTIKVQDGLPVMVEEGVKKTKL